jgi:hypothetical protein
LESDQAQKKSVLANLNRWHLLLAGYSEAEIVGLGELSQLRMEQVRDLLHSKKLEAMKATGEALTKEGVKIKPTTPKRAKRKTIKQKSRKHRTTKK